MSNGMRRTARLALLAALFLAAGGWTPAFADNLSPDSPYSQPGQTATNQSGTPSGSQASTPADMDKYNSEFHNSFQNLMPDAPPPGYSTMMGKWVTTLYGFVEMDTMYDSSNSFNNWPFNGAPANAQTIQGGYVKNGTAYQETALGKTLNHDYWGFDVNNSRIGFALSSPVYNGYKVRALLEMDFLASPGETQYGLGGGFNGGYITNPIFRIRHFFGDVTTPWYGNFLFGQYWSLFGWQPYNIYNSVQIAPAPGTLYGRFPQLRWYKIFNAGEGVKVEPAVAMMLPPEPSSGVPAFVEGLKLADSDMMGEMMIGNTGKGQFPASLGFSAIQTNYAGYFDNSYTPTPKNTTGTPYSSGQSSYNSWTSSEAVDLILPIIPIHDGKPGNNLTLQAEYSWGQGDAWQFPNLSFGMGQVGNCNASSPASGYNCSINAPGLSAGEGVLNGGYFEPLDIQTYNVDLQYYFPDDARTSISIGFAAVDASNLQQVANFMGPASLGGGGSTNGLYKYLAPDSRETYAFVNIWHDFTPAVRAGLEYGQYDSLYTTGLNALDNRVMMSWFYLF